MNRRLNRIGSMFLEAGLYFPIKDPVGLTPEENSKVWDKIIQDDIDKKTEIDKLIEEMKSNQLKPEYNSGVKTNKCCSWVAPN